MTCLNFVSLFGRPYFSNSVQNRRFLFPKYADSLCFKNLSIRVCSSSSRVTFSNLKIKPASLLNVKQFETNNKILVKVCLRHSRVYEHVRYFHTSEQRYFHPIVWAVLRPALKLLAIITGRAFRKWWKKLPPNKRRYFWQQIKDNSHKIAIFIVSSTLLSAIYYVNHLEETPITKRRRFIAFSSEQLKKINQLEFKQTMLEMQDKTLPANHPSSIRVKAVVNRILQANKDIKEMKGKTWGVSVLNSPVENAFVLPIGHVFVFTGMLTLCSNDDELGIILSHEIAHCIANHGAESLSLHHLLDLASVVIIAAIWAIIPSDTLSILTHWLYHKSLQIFFQLPYQRSMETEADAIGLILAAKACFDVRESSAFWAKVAFLHNTIGKPDIEFLSTHPSHERRSDYLDGIMDQAISLRLECGCPRLKSVDPRLNVEIMAKALDAARKKYFQQHPKPIVRFDI